MSFQSTTLVPPDFGGPPEPVPPIQPWRRWRVTLIAAAGIVVLVIPLLLFFVLRSDAPQQATNPVPPTPAPTVSEPAPTPTTTPGQPPPDGRISAAELANATLNVPAWPADNLTCLSGPLKFVKREVVSPPDARFDFDRHLLVNWVGYGDFDRDGAQETLAEVGCWVQGGSLQIVAFDRNTQGQIVTMGVVAATTGEIRTIENVRVPADNTIRATVGDYARCCGDETPRLTQDRTYEWTGSRFVQVGGPTSFPVNPHVTETGVQAGQLVFGPPVNGYRHGTITVTVTYLRGATPDHLALRLIPPPGIERDGSNWPPIRDGDNGFVVDLPTPAKGASATYTFAFRQAVNTGTGEFRLYLSGERTQDMPFGESNPFNNSMLITIRSTN